MTDYLQLRLNLGRTIEGDRPRIYLDIHGVPTIGIGVALIYEDRVAKKWFVYEDRLPQIEELTGVSFTDTELTNLQQIANALTLKGRAFYPDGAKTPGSFLETPTGKLISETVGFETDADGKLTWTLMGFDGISLPSTASATLFNNMMDAEYERQVDNLLQKSGFDVDSVSPSARAAYALMVYKDWREKWGHSTFLGRPPFAAARAGAGWLEDPGASPCA